MQFGKRAAEAPKLTGERGSGGARYMRTLKPGEYKMRFLQETDDWYQYWEHYNPMPGGFPFPCTGDKSSCPGCTSGIEKMEKASPKYAVNARVGDYVDIYKFPVKFFNKMEIRSERNGKTILDREFLITRIGNDTQTDYDIDMLMPSDAPTGLQVHDVEESLQAAFQEAWPDWSLDGGDAGTTREAPKDEARAAEKSGLNEFSKPKVAPEPEAETEVTEASLRAMSPEDLRDLCKRENVPLPEDLNDTKTIVDWMLANL